MWRDRERWGGIGRGGEGQGEMRRDRKRWEGQGAVGRDREQWGGMG